MSPSEYDTDVAMESRGVDCAALELATGAVVIYNPENHRGWVQSDVGVTLRNRR